MKRFAVAIAVSVFGGLSAHAADLAEPLAAAPSFSWAGLYVGAQAGGGWNNSRWSTSDPFTPTFNTNGSGGVFGGQIGYNWQIDQYVIGIEGDLAASTVKGADQCSVDVGSNCQTKQDYLASVRGRLGYAIDHLLIYGDGGVAFTNYKLEETQPFQQSFDAGHRIGWTVGIGAEYAFADHWTAGLEWNYYDFGSKSAFSPLFAGNPPIDFRETENTVVAKINYKF